MIKDYRVHDGFTGTANAAAFIVDRAGRIRYQYVSGAPPDLPPETDIIVQLREIVKSA